jgi:hypothetical protein
MTRGLLLCAMATVSAVSASSCRVLGLQPDACEVGDDTTCPSGQFCDPTAIPPRDIGPHTPACVKGANPATTPVDVVTDESEVGAVVVDAKTGDVFFATGAAPGCIRELKLGATKAADFACEATDKIGALTVDDSDVFWTVDAGGPDGAARAQSRAAAGAQPQTLANGMTVTPQSGGGSSSMNVAHHSDGSESIMFSRRDPDVKATRVLRSSSGAVTYQADYGDPFPDTVDQASAVLPMPDNSAAFVGVRFDDGTATLAYRLPSEDVPQGGEGGLDGTVDMTSVHKPLGTVSSLVVLDAQSSSIVVATTAGDGGGSVVKMGTSTFASKLLAAQADPESPRTHASALTTDGFFAYYATAGTPSPGHKRGLFKIDLFAPNAKPIRLVDLDVDGGGVAFNAKTARVLWAEPANNRIRSVAAPHVPN